MESHNTPKEHQNQKKPPTAPNQTEDARRNYTRQRHKSRNKQKCTFRPNKQQKDTRNIEGKTAPESPRSVGSSPITTPFIRGITPLGDNPPPEKEKDQNHTRVSKGKQQIEERRETFSYQATKRQETASTSTRPQDDRFPLHRREEPSHHVQQTPPADAERSPLHREHPARVTLTLPDRPRKTPFDRYKATAEETPRPNPNRFALQRLGLSEEELDARVAAKVDELLRVCKAERRLDQLSTGPSPLAAPRVLTKEDCLTLFNATGVPTSRSLVGAFWWAVDLSTARFNFDLG